MTAQAGVFDFALPDFGPIVPERPAIGPGSHVPFAMASLSYAEERAQSAAGAFDALGYGAVDLQAWKSSNPAAASENSADDYVAAGSYDSAVEARRVASELAGFGKSEIEQSERDGKVWYSVNLYPDGHGSLDDLLQAAWSHGAPDALAVRD
jgi:rare lipoprotein A